MGILIDNRQTSQRIPLGDMREKALAVLGALGNPEAELSIVFVDDEGIADLNRQYLKREGATNVIAFPMREGAYSDISPQLLGDVVISVDTAERESKMAGVTMETRLEELLVHGILHLFGYDHETNQQDARQMEKKHLELIHLIRTHHK
jgi:probable rRNA maturation factor